MLAHFPIDVAMPLLYCRFVPTNACFLLRALSSVSCIVHTFLLHIYLSEGTVSDRPQLCCARVGGSACAASVKLFGELSPHRRRSFTCK